MLTAPFFFTHGGMAGVGTDSLGEERDESVAKLQAVKRSVKAELSGRREARVSQRDVPSISLDDALRVPAAILDQYAGQPVTSLQLASALGMLPTSGNFRTLTGAAIAYGLTDGGYNATSISVQALARQILRPKAEDDDLRGKREAFMQPRITGTFLKQYDGSPIPRDDIAFNVLEGMDIPRERAQRVFRLIIDGAKSLGLVREIKGRSYIDLSGVQASEGIRPKLETAKDIMDEVAAEDAVVLPLRPELSEERSSGSKALASNDSSTAERAKRVFVTHGKNREFIEPIKKLLGFGGFVPVVSAENQSVSKPVPEKVMDDMRSCGAAIIHVDREQVLIDQDAKEQVVINPNVLIEIGAAMALYNQRFILLVRDGVRLPSNLQGLYEVRYDGDSLGSDGTIRLLEAINEIKKYALPA